MCSKRQIAQSEAFKILNAFKTICLKPPFESNESILAVSLYICVSTLIIMMIHVGHVTLVTIRVSRFLALFVLPPRLSFVSHYLLIIFISVAIETSDGHIRSSLHHLTYRLSS